MLLLRLRIHKRIEDRKGHTKKIKSNQIIIRIIRIIIIIMPMF